MIYSNLTTEFSFDDDTQRLVTVGPFNPNSQAVSYFRAKVQQFNDNIPSDFQQNFLSNDGASCTGITAATVTTYEKTVLFAKSAEYASRAQIAEVVDNGNN